MAVNRVLPEMARVIFLDSFPWCTAGGWGGAAEWSGDDESKRFGETLCVNFVRQHGLPINLSIFASRRFGLDLRKPDFDVGAIKLPGGERIATLRALVPEHVALGVSGDWFAAEALANGADVWFSVLGGLFPEGARRVMAGEDFEPLWDLFRRYGSVRVVATVAALRGLTGEPNLPRPLIAAPPAEVAPVLDQLGL